jgi:hypothetical protein
VSAVGVGDKGWELLAKLLPLLPTPAHHVISFGCGGALRTAGVSKVPCSLMISLSSGSVFAANLLFYYTNS